MADLQLQSQSKFFDTVAAMRQKLALQAAVSRKRVVERVKNRPWLPLPSI